MLSKFGILITILVLVFLFFIVISFGAGAFSKDKVKPEIKKYLKLDLQLNTRSKIKSPGQEKTHYSPYIKLRLNVKNLNKNEAFMLIKKRKITDRNFYYLISIHTKPRMKV